MSKCLAPTSVSGLNTDSCSLDWRTRHLIGREPGRHSVRESLLLSPDKTMPYSCCCNESPGYQLKRSNREHRFNLCCDSIRPSPSHHPSSPQSSYLIHPPPGQSSPAK